MDSESEGFTLVIDLNTSEPIYHVDGTVLVQRNSDGYQFFVEPGEVTLDESKLQNASPLSSCSTSMGSTNSNRTLTELTASAAEKHWSRTDILKLIEEYRKNKENFASSSIRNSKIWQQIAGTLGGRHDARQCENKFKYLRSKYIKKKDNMSTNQSGAARLHFEFFDELDVIFHKEPIIIPVIASSSRANQIEMETEGANQQPESFHTNNQTGQPELESPPSSPPANQQLRTRNIRLRDTINNLNNILKESEEKKEKRHQELLNIQKESLNTFKSLMEKILDKM